MRQFELKGAKPSQNELKLDSQIQSKRVKAGLWKKK